MTKGIPTLRSLRNLQTLLEALTTHKTAGYGYVGFSIWDVPIVLTDQGMTSELDALLNDFREEGNPDRTAQFIHWARARAERVDSERLYVSDCTSSSFAHGLPTNVSNRGLFPSVTVIQDH